LLLATAARIAECSGWRRVIREQGREALAMSRQPLTRSEGKCAQCRPARNAVRPVPAEQISTGGGQVAQNKVATVVVLPRAPEGRPGNAWHGGTLKVKRSILRYNP